MQGLVVLGWNAWAFKSADHQSSTRYGIVTGRRRPNAVFTFRTNWLTPHLYKTLVWLAFNGQRLSRDSRGD